MPMLLIEVWADMTEEQQQELRLFDIQFEMIVSPKTATVRKADNRFTPPSPLPIGIAASD
jgi:hypothetical protein